MLGKSLTSTLRICGNSVLCRPLSYVAKNQDLSLASCQEDASEVNYFRLGDEDYDRFFNFFARNRKPSLIRSMIELQSKATPNTVSLSGGFPNPKFFPFKDAVFNLKNGEKIQLDETMLQQGQQYSPTSGHPPLLETIRGVIKKYHNPPNWANSMMAITAGSQDGFSRSLEMMLTPGDYVIVEEPSFCGAFGVMNPYHPRYLRVETDALGMKPESLAKLLSRWSPEEVREANEGVPKVIYTNPTATNPSGASLPVERKQAIYEIARNYNLIILEDDPYYFLQFDQSQGLPKSFLSLDTDGRVMRFDSFSKVICSGMRVGYTTGPAKLVTKMLQHTEVTILHTSTLSQVIVNELLKHWSFEGLENHMAQVRKFYVAQRDALNEAATKHLTGLCKWDVPTGGMFLWVKILGIEDATDMALKRAPMKELLLMPGSTFMPLASDPCPYLRLSFSFSSPDAMEEGCKRLAELIKEEIELNSIARKAQTD